MTQHGDRVTQGMISGWERGHSIPSERYWPSLERCLGVTPDDLGSCFAASESERALLREKALPKETREALAKIVRDLIAAHEREAQEVPGGGADTDA
ncbi:helix-turn-helix domain-containing protein [Haloechinothrix halophila]